jgi:Phage protein Gp138 N-terminal domain
MTSPTTLSDAVRAAVLYQLNIIHTSFPGIIVSYDFTTQKATIQPALNKKYTDGVVRSMPILNNVPVIFPRSGGAALTFPISPGDTVLVICSERSLDNWLNTGGQVTPVDPRKFDLSDGIAIPGLFPFSQSSPAPNNSDVVLQYQGSKIIIDSTGNVKIETSATVAIGNSAVEVLNILSQALGLLAGAATVVVPVTPFTGPLAISAALTALQAQLNTIKGTIP